MDLKIINEPGLPTEGTDPGRRYCFFIKALNLTKLIILGVNWVKKTLYQQVIVPTVTYGAETWGLGEAERCRLNVFEMKCLRPMVGVTRRDRIRNEEIRRRTGIEETLAEKVDRRVLHWFGQVKRMD